MYFVYKWYNDKPSDLKELWLISGIIELLSESILVLTLLGVIK